MDVIGSRQARIGVIGVGRGHIPQTAALDGLYWNSTWLARAASVNSARIVTLLPASRLPLTAL